MTEKTSQPKKNPPVDGVEEIMHIVRYVIKKEIAAGHLAPGPVKMEE